jgi:hypothetical protein
MKTSPAKPARERGSGKFLWWMGSPRCVNTAKGRDVSIFVITRGGLTKGFGGV